MSRGHQGQAADLAGGPVRLPPQRDAGDTAGGVWAARRPLCTSPSECSRNAPGVGGRGPCSLERATPSTRTSHPETPAPPSPPATPAVSTRGAGAGPQGHGTFSPDADGPARSMAPSRLTCSGRQPLGRARVRGRGPSGVTGYHAAVRMGPDPAGPVSLSEGTPDRRAREGGHGKTDSGAMCLHLGTPRTPAAPHRAEGPLPAPGPRASGPGTGSAGVGC